MGFLQNFVLSWKLIFDRQFFVKMEIPFKMKKSNLFYGNSWVFSFFFNMV